MWMGGSVGDPLQKGKGGLARPQDGDCHHGGVRANTEGSGEKDAFGEVRGLGTRRGGGWGFYRRWTEIRWRVEEGAWRRQAEAFRFCSQGLESHGIF